MGPAFGPVQKVRYNSKLDLSMRGIRIIYAKDWQIGNCSYITKSGLSMRGIRAIYAKGKANEPAQSRIRQIVNAGI